VPPKSVPAGNRIIPARAGFTRSPRGHAKRAADHPRSRGVYELQSASPPSYTGSSPLARGLLSVGARERDDIGIIPARAGFTADWPSRCGSRSDHPRSRGVYGRPAPRPGPLPLEGRGSSPLARGLRIVGLVGRPHDRIIPARAGFTHFLPQHDLASPDHPRSRGVYILKMPTVHNYPGSSPLARGLRFMGDGDD